MVLNCTEMYRSDPQQQHGNGKSSRVWETAFWPSSTIYADTTTNFLHYDAANLNHLPFGGWHFATKATNSDGKVDWEDTLASRSRNVSPDYENLRENTENIPKETLQAAVFFCSFLLTWPRPLSLSALAPSFSILQLLAGSRARRPAKSLSGLWIGPDGLCGPQRVQLCRPQNNISGSHTRGELMALPPFVCWGFPVVPQPTHCP